MMAVAPMRAVTIQVNDPATWDVYSLSSYVGQTITFDCPMYISYNGGWSGSSFRIGPRRVYSPTNNALPGSVEYQNILTLNNRATLTVTGVPDDNGTTRRTGSVIRNLTVKLNSTTNATWVSGTFVANSRQDMINMANAGFPDLYDHHHDSINVLVCGMNLEYYLTTAYDGNYGPADATEHQKQRAKVSEALAAIGADIYGLVEIQKGNGALAELASDLTTNTGHPYRYVDSKTSVSGTYTQSGFIYRSDRVAPIGSVQKISTVGSSFKDRLALIRFQVIDNGGTFIYSINHYKAKSGTGTGNDADQGNGQGQYNHTRTQQANATIAKYKELSSSWGEKDVLFMGDLNAYGLEDPITTFTNQGYTDLHRYFHADSSYSYTYNGTAGYLDHAIVNPTMLAQVKGMMAYHINSDENDKYTYDSSNDRTRFRCSDHDPILVAMYVQPENSASGLEELFDRITPTYYRIYTIRGELIHAGAEMDLPDAPGIYIVVKYGIDGSVDNILKVANRKYEVR